jgi:hypothetical protein
MFGCPEQVLTDNGKQFTGRFGKPRPAEVLFERICRRNGITTILTKPRSPTTTGKVERFHQSLQGDCFSVQGPFVDVPAAQQAVDAFVAGYNHHRPHQALNDQVPASRFIPIPAEQRRQLGLDVPAELLDAAPVTPFTVPSTAPAEATPIHDLPASHAAADAASPSRHGEGDDARARPGPGTSRARLGRTDSRWSTHASPRLHTQSGANRIATG